MLTEFETDCAHLKDRMDHGHDFVLLDCREDWEWEISRIDGATLIPMSQLNSRVTEIEPFSQSPIVVYCHHGVRSLNVTMWLRQRGFQNVLSLHGGIEEWSQTIDESVPRY